MKVYERITISLTSKQYEYIEKIAKEKFEEKFSQALRYVVEKARIARRG